MKIALVCPYNMFERAGGVTQVIQHLHDGLVKKGHTVKIITQRPSGYTGEVPKDYILFGVVRNFKSGLGTHAHWGMPADNDEMSRILDSEQFDVIHFHEPWAPMLAWQMLKHSKAAHVATFHANLIDSAVGKSWVNVFLPYGRGIGQKMHIMTAVSEAPAAVLVEKAQKEFEKKLVENIKYIPNGIDLRLYVPPKKRQPLNGPNTKTVVYVGRLERRKGVSYLIRAFAELEAQMPNAHLIVAGEGGLRKSLEQTVKSLKLQNVRFTGYVDEDEKRRLMGNADLVCSPAVFGESFGIVLIEAMAMGAPVLAGNNMGYRSVMKGLGRVGLVDPHAAEDFANRMAVVLDDPSLANLMRRWGLREVKQYDYPRVVDMYENAYKEALAIAHNGDHKDDKDAKPKRSVRRLFIRRHS